MGVPAVFYYQTLKSKLINKNLLFLIGDEQNMTEADAFHSR